MKCPGKLGNSRKIFWSTTTETQRVYSSKPLPVKLCETRDACVQTSSLTIPVPYCQDDIEGLKIYPDVSYYFKFSKEKIVSENE